MIERKNLWYITLKMGLDNPLGVGIGNWPVCAPKYNRLIEPVIRKNSFIKSYYRRAHDGFLQIFSETGYAGLIFYGSIFTTAIRQAVKNRIILASFLAFTNFNIFSFPTERPFLCLIFVFLLASTMPGNMYPVKKRYLFPVIVLVMLSLSFAGHVFYVRHQTETNLRQFYRLIKHKKWKEAAQRTEHCSWLSKLNFSGDPIPYHYGIALLEQGEIETLIKYGYVPKCVYTNTEKASKAFKQALAVNPYHAFSLVNLGICYVKMEMYGEAKKCYEICKYLYPEYEKPKDELAYLNYVIERMYR